MRSVGAGDAAQPTSGLGPGAITAAKIEVANAADALVDLTEFVVSLEYEQTTDEIVDAATIVFRRLEGVSSLAPLMTASPPVALGRRVVVSINPGSGTYTEVFRGTIEDVDWPERFGDVTCKCLDQAGAASATWIEDPVQYSTTAGVSLETVMQAVADDNLTTPPTLYFPAATASVVAHVEGDPPYGPSEQSVLDAERALAESIGWTIRYRHFGASASDWKWTVFQPSRTKVAADHTFATSTYWNVTQMEQSTADIRNVVRVEYTGEGGARATVEVEDATSIAAYGRRFMKISEAADSPINNATAATALANAALSDLKDPDALLEIEASYFWPGEVGVDLYTFTANEVHFTDDQTLGAMAFRHRIAVGERPTTWITCRGKPSGGVLMWRRRSAVQTMGSGEPDLAVYNLREVARTQTEVTQGWSASGDLDEIWVYYATPAQPLASDPWANFTGQPTVRLTGATTSYSFAVPDVGSVTYVQMVPIGVRTNVVVRGAPHRFTLQGEQIRLIQRIVEVSASATQIVVDVYVANPITGGDITIAYANPGGLTIAPASGQTLSAASVTADPTTTGAVRFTITRAAQGSNPARVTFTASATDRISDVDAVDVAPQFDRFRCRVTRSGTYSLTTLTAYNVAFDTEGADNGGLHDNATNSDRITFPTGSNVGFWIISGHVTIVHNGAGNGSIFQLDLNHSTGSVLLDWDEFQVNGSEGFSRLKVTAMVVAPAATSYVNLTVTPTFSAGSPYIATGQTFFEAIHVF